MDDGTTCTCHFCKKTVSYPEALGSDWYPGFWAGEKFVSEPVCVDCGREKLRIDDATGEYVLSESAELDVILDGDDFPY